MMKPGRRRNTYSLEFKRKIVAAGRLLLIDVWASFKSFKCKGDDQPPKAGGDGTGMVDFKGKKRSNVIHQSTTDPQAKLMRKGNGQPAKLSYGGHALMDNRSGPCMDLLITDATLAEHQAGRGF